jgi:DNA primase
MSDLRQKIDEGKRRLPLPELMAREGLKDRAKTRAHCPFHDDKHKSFSVFQGKDGFWHWKCFTGCGEGDEIMFLRKRKGLSMTKAMNLFLDMAGFPPSRPPKSHECRKSLRSPKCLESPKYHESLDGNNA